jgi:hypothetical protein
MRTNTPPEAVTPDPDTEIEPNVGAPFASCKGGKQCTCVNGRHAFTGLAGLIVPSFEAIQ